MNSRCRSPRRSNAVQLPLQVMSTHANVVLQRTIITCGKFAVHGKRLLRTNHRLKNPKWCYDVTDALHDPFHPRDSFDGTHVQTQRRIATLEHFAEVHTWILSTMLMERYTVVICNHGRHRSVGAAELAVQDLLRIQHCSFDVQTIHIDLLHEISAELWNELRTI